MPSHHQSEYFRELSKLSHLQVIYTGKQDKIRKELGWKLPNLQRFEHYNTFKLLQLFSLFKYRKSVHVITGCGSLSNIIIWGLCTIFKLKWCHLSENIPDQKSRSVIKRLIINSYYRSVNSLAICAFAIGNKAKRSFTKLGVDDSHIFITNYSSAINEGVQRNLNNRPPIQAIVLGNISYCKGVDIILNVISSFPEELRVDFYGAEQDKNMQLVMKIDHIENAEYKGIVSSDLIDKLFSKYDLLLFLSRDDGWGMAVHEAISNDVPVICSSEAGCSEHLIVDGFNGFVIPPNKTALKKAIKDYIATPELLHTHSKNCNAHKMAFSPENTALKFVKNLTSRLN